MPHVPLKRATNVTLNFIGLICFWFYLLNCSFYSEAITGAGPSHPILQDLPGSPRIGLDPGYSTPRIIQMELEKSNHPLSVD